MPRSSPRVLVGDRQALSPSSSSATDADGGATSCARSGARTQERSQGECEWRWRSFMVTASCRSVELMRLPLVVELLGQSRTAAARRTGTNGVLARADLLRPIGGVDRRLAHVQAGSPARRAVLIEAERRALVTSFPHASAPWGALQCGSELAGDRAELSEALPRPAPNVAAGVPRSATLVAIGLLRQESPSPMRLPPAGLGFAPAPGGLRLRLGRGARVGCAAAVASPAARLARGGAARPPARARARAPGQSPRQVRTEGIGRGRSQAHLVRQADRSSARASAPRRASSGCSISAGRTARRARPTAMPRPTPFFALEVG